MEGRRPSRVSRLGNSIRSPGAQTMCCLPPAPPTPLPSPPRKASFPVMQLSRPRRSLCHHICCHHLLQGMAASGVHCRITFLMTTRKPDINGQFSAPCLGTPLFREPLPCVGDDWRWKVSGNGSSPRHCISAPKGRRRLWPWSESLNHRIPEREEP